MLLCSREQKSVHDTIANNSIGSKKTFVVTLKFCLFSMVLNLNHYVSKSIYSNYRESIALNAFSLILKCDIQNHNIFTLPVNRVHELFYNIF